MKKLWLSLGGVSGLTLVSRLLGFVRDFLMAVKVGAGFALDAYVIAFQIPNFLRRLFAEGAFTQAFVPVLHDVMAKQSPEAQHHFVRVLLGRMILALTILTLLVMALAPWAVMLYAPGFARHAGQAAFSAQLLRWTFPYLMCVAVTALFAGVLNTHKRFMAAAAAPIALNVCLILTLIVPAHNPQQAVKHLAWAMPWAGFVQVLWTGWHVYRRGFPVWPLFRASHPAVRRVTKLILTGLYGVSVSQIGLLIDTLLASFLVMGSVSWLYFANRLFQLPLALIGVALSTLSLPYLSQLVSAQDHQGFAEQLDWASKMTMVFGVPAAFGLMMGAYPIAVTCLMHGHFHAHDAAMTAPAVMAFSVGLPAMMLQKILASACYAQQDIRGPVRIATRALLVNVSMALVSMSTLGHVGLALAQSCAAWYQAGALIKTLKRASFAWQWRGDWRPWLAGVVMSLVLYALPSGVTWLGMTPGHRVGLLAAWIAVGIGTYFLVLWSLGMRLHDLSGPSHGH